MTSELSVDASVKSLLTSTAASEREDSRVEAAFEDSPKGSRFFSDAVFELAAETKVAPVHLIDQSIPERQKQWHGLDFDVQESAAYVRHQRTFTHNEIKLMKMSTWVTSFLIGLSTAIVAFLIDFFIGQITSVKFGLILEPRTNYGDDRAIPALLYIAINTFLVMIASAFVVCLETVAAGSGIPEIKGELNGVKMPRVLRLKTLVVKATGVLFSVAGALPIGKEGPMIHSGAILGSGWSQGGSWTMGMKTRVNEKFRNDTHKRDFVACGAAAGVSAAFGAPIGGVLFAIEEGASFWSIPLTWRSFLAAMTATFTLNILISTTDPTRIVNHKNLGILDNPGVIEFGSFGTYKDSPWQLAEIPAFIILGALMGLAGALFNCLNHKLTAFRMRYIPVSKGYRRWLEAIGVVILVSIVGAIAPLCFSLSDSCIPRHKAGSDPKVISTLRTYYCKSDHFNEAATLWFSQSEKAILQLFHSTYEFNEVVLFFFALTYYLLACLTYGLAVPSGLFVPSLTAGAAFGRLYGSLLRRFIPGVSPAGSYALFGAASMLGGIARITISATVIIIESTQNVSYALPIMLTIMVAKWVGDLFNHGLYDIHNTIKGVPYLEPDAGHEAIHLSISDMMRDLPSPTSLRLVCRVRDVVTVLGQTTYSAFPIVKSRGPDLPPTVLGLIARSRLVVLLKLNEFKHGDTPEPRADGMELRDGVRGVIDESALTDEYPRFPVIEDVPLRDEDLEAWMDLSPYYNPCPYTVRDCAPLTRLYRLFRLVGVRHVPIVDEQNGLLAVATRKIITEEKMEEAFHELKFHRSGAGKMH